MRITPEIGDASIVLVGSFNPRIFTPEWFAKNGLLNEDEAEDAEVEIIHREITIFRTGWLSLSVQQGRFSVTTEEVPLINLADLVVRTFKEFLTHTPIEMMGINRRVHFSANDQAKLENIGNTLAPKVGWGEWGSKIGSGVGEKHGGMRSIAMEQRELDDRSKGYILAKVAPSTKVKFGIFMEINDHYEVKEGSMVTGCDDIITKLEECFDKSIKRSEEIIDQIMSLV